MSVDFDIRELRRMEVGGETVDVWCVVEGAPAGLNLANGNARLVLDALGIEAEDLCGQVAPSELLARIGRARAGLAEQPSEFERSLNESGGPGTGQCRMVTPGLTADQILDRLARLEALASACAPGQVIGWA